MLRARAAVLVPLTTCGALLVFAGGASALQIGPVNVPVTVPAVPVLAPVVGSDPVVLPDASVTASPDDGVVVGVTIPGAVGPVTVSTDPPSVQVTVDPSGVDVTSSPTPSGSDPTSGSAADPATDASGSDPTSPAAADPTPSDQVDPSATTADPTASSPVSDVPANQSGSHASAPARARVKTTKDPVVDTPGALAPAAATDAASSSLTSSISGASRGASPGASAVATPAPKEVAVPDAVNASLQHAAPGGSWTLAREAVTGRFALWLALLAILGVVRWALIGLVRDARRRARCVSPV